MSSLLRCQPVSSAVRILGKRHHLRYKILLTINSMKNDGGFQHYDGLKIIAAIGFIVAMVAPALANYLERYELGSLHWIIFIAILIVTVLCVFLVLMLIFIFLTRDKETKEERLQRELEERCSDLLTQAIVSCRCASKDAEGYQKTWMKPKNTVVQQAIWGNHPVGNPELCAILHNAWKAGDRCTELALQLMYASWDLWAQCYDYESIKQNGLDEQALIMGFQQPYEYLGGHQSENHTLLLIAGHMITLFDYQTGLTLNDAEMCLKRFLEVCPEGLPDAEFEGRGGFGEYFTHIIGRQLQ